MKITCDSCGAKYTIADDKVRGRKVKIRCKGCASPIVVDGQQDASAKEPPSVSEEQEELSTAGPSLTPAGELEWLVNLSETEQISLSTERLVEGWKAGRIGTDAFVWRDGMPDWVPILECTEIAPLLPSRLAETIPQGPEASASAVASPQTASPDLQPSGAAVRAAPNAARVTGSRAQKASDLFAAVDSAGAEDEEVATSAPVLPLAVAGRVEEKPTGARNENSVLFSLDAMKAGFSAPAPPARTKPVETSSPDPLRMGVDSRLPSLSGGGQLFTLSDNQALLTAPAAIEMKGSPVHGAGDHGLGQPRKRLALVAGAGIALLGTGVLLGLYFLGGSPSATAENRPLTERSGPVEAKAAAEGVDRGGTAEPKEAVKPPTSTASAGDSPIPSSDDKATDDKDDKDDKATDDKDDKTEEKSDRQKSRNSSSSSKDKSPSKEASKPSGTAAPFNRGAAVSSLSAAASRAASCKRAGGPTGTGKVQVTFSPTGRVTSAVVPGPPFAGTSVGGCVASVFRRAKVPAFSGGSLTVAKSFTIR